MADKFQCDSCKQMFKPLEKRGTIELKADGSDVLPHANFVGKLDLCNTCFAKYEQMFIHVNPELTPFVG
jgi:hypothetical protein